MKARVEREQAARREALPKLREVWEARRQEAAFLDKKVARAAIENGKPAKLPQSTKPELLCFWETHWVPTHVYSQLPGSTTKLSISSNRCVSLPSVSRTPVAVKRAAHSPAVNKRQLARCQASTADDQPPEEDFVDYAAVAARLNNLVAKPPGLSGPELREMVYKRFKRSYDVRLRRIGTKVYLQIMWRFLEQQSFPLTSDEYDNQLDAVAELLTDWDCATLVRDSIKAQKKHPGYTVGGGAQCVSIPLPVDMDTLKMSGFV
eukprot:gene9798-7686_t